MKLGPAECPGYFFKHQQLFNRVSHLYCEWAQAKSSKDYLAISAYLHRGCKAAVLFKKLLKIDAGRLTSPPVSWKTHRGLSRLPVATPVADRNIDAPKLTLMPICAVKAVPVHYIRFTFAMFNSAMPRGIAAMPSAKVKLEHLLLFDMNSIIRRPRGILPRKQVSLVMTEVFQYFALELRKAFKDDSDGAKSRLLQDTLCASDLYYR